MGIRGRLGCARSTVTSMVALSPTTSGRPIRSKAVAPIMRHVRIAPLSQTTLSRAFPTRAPVTEFARARFSAVVRARPRTGSESRTRIPARTLTPSSVCAPAEKYELSRCLAAASSIFTKTDALWASSGVPLIKSVAQTRVRKYRMVAPIGAKPGKLDQDSNANSYSTDALQVHHSGMRLRSLLRRHAVGGCILSGGLITGVVVAMICFMD